MLGPGSDMPPSLTHGRHTVSRRSRTWELPHFAWLAELNGIARVITFDKRGTGLSDGSLGFGSVEERSRDVTAVMDAAGSCRAILCDQPSGCARGGFTDIVASTPQAAALGDGLWRNLMDRHDLEIRGGPPGFRPRGPRSPVTAHP